MVGKPSAAQTSWASPGLPASGKTLGSRDMGSPDCPGIGRGTGNVSVWWSDLLTEVKGQAEFTG